MHALIVLQRSEGSWELTHELAAVVGRELSDLEAAIASATGNRKETRRAWATAVALAWLQDHASEYSDEWRLLARKAQDWLQRVAAAPPNGGAWMDAASRFLRA